jgi:hypothetical protein
MIDPSIPLPLAAIVERELEREERVVWIGMPRPTFFTAASTAAFLFAIPWTAFALFWTWGAAGFRIPNFNQPFDLFPLFGVPFILIGFGMLSVPLLSYRNSLKTVYVITDRRAITIEGGRSTTIRSFSPAQLSGVFRREKKDGSGDVIFERTVVHDKNGGKRSEELGFMRVPHVQDVERKLKCLAAQEELGSL